MVPRAVSAVVATFLHLRLAAAVVVASESRSAATGRHLYHGHSGYTKAAAKAVTTLDANRKKNKAYAYPKTDNLLLCFMVGLRHQLSPMYPDDDKQLSWEDPELDLWKRGQAFIAMTPRRNYLDIGCGMGRVVAKFGGLFESTTCLEPDQHRVKDAITAMNLESFAHRVTYANTRFLDYEGVPGTYDVISCVQVMQHLPLREPGLWFKKIHTLLRPGGVLLVATTMENTTQYKATDGAGVSWFINATDFDQRASDTTHSGALPVHHYTTEELAAQAESSGFRVVEQRGFSFWGSLPCSQYLVAVKRDVAEAGELLPLNMPLPRSPPVSEVHVSGMEEYTLATLRNIRSGLDTQCVKK